MDNDQTTKPFVILGGITALALVIAVPLVLSWQIGPMIGLGFWKTLGLLLLLRFWLN